MLSFAVDQVAGLDMHFVFGRSFANPVNRDAGFQMQFADVGIVADADCLPSPFGNLNVAA